jgi:energy-coupling factor transporter ATP-binding protein EcfA2
MVKTRLYGQDQVFQNILDTLHDLPHIFLTGVPGCGKTTFLEDLMELIKEKNIFRIESILWLSSEKDRGIHTIRDRVNDFCKQTHSKPNSLRFIIIDDADTLPLISQQALRRPMEQYAHLTKFLFASRHANHLIEPLRSRCLTVELEPVSILDVFPMYCEAYSIPTEWRNQQLLDFCLRNFIHIRELQSLLALLSAFSKEGKTQQESIECCKSLLPSSKIFIHSLLDSLAKKDIPSIYKSLTDLFYSGYLLDDILLSIERSITVFPSVDPDVRFRILQFTMLGWISIQQGKEHWLDAVDILEEVLRTETPLPNLSVVQKDA